MRIKISENGWFPVYEESDFGTEVDILPGFLKGWRKAKKSFEKVQEEVEKLYEAAELKHNNQINR